MQYDKDILNKTGIFVFDNALSKENCRIIIQNFYDNKKKHHKGRLSGGTNDKIKNTTDLHLEGYPAEILTSCVSVACEKIIAARPSLNELRLYYTGMQFQKNEKGKGFFRWHIDYNTRDKNNSRILAPIFYLNDVEEGGQTEFMYQKFKVKPEAGKLIIFPATWQYYHRGVIPKSNDKYIVTCFINTPRG